MSLLFGHFGFKVAREVRDLGLLLFVYAVGLQAGPRFFRAFKRQGLPFVITGVVSVLAAAISTAIVARLWHIAPELTNRALYRCRDQYSCTGGCDRHGGTDCLLEGWEKSALVTVWHTPSA